MGAFTWSNLLTAIGLTWGVVLVIAGVAAGIFALKLKGKVDTTSCAERHGKDGNRLARIEERLRVVYDGVRSLREDGVPTHNPHPRQPFPDWPEDEPEGE